MALLSRLFSSKKSNKQHLNVNVDNNERSTWRPFAFQMDQVRILLYRECDWRGRKLLFDSSAVQKVSLGNSSCKLRFSNLQKSGKAKKDAYVEITNDCGYQYTKPSSDATMFGEMMFGAVAMAFRGTALKVHSIPNPNRLMCTKVFPSPEVSHYSRSSDRSLEDSFGSSINSMNEYYSQSGSDSKLESGPLDVPATAMSGGYSSLTGDSGYCGDFSIQTVSSLTSSYWTPVSSPGSTTRDGSLYTNGKQSGSSLSSLQRRWLRNVSTSLELASHDATDEMNHCNGQHRRTRLGVSVLITLTAEQHREMESFVFEHMSVIEAMIERLRNTIEKAYLRKDMFVHMVYEGFLEIGQALSDMFTMPRLECPMWLNLGLNSIESKKRTNLSASFLQDLCQLITTLDTKATNFFVSTLVTGILTHHLGWVNTVWSNNSQPSLNADNGKPLQSLSELSKSNPYNPLWAQLGDLYGALGSPTKVAKTIVTSNGRKADSLNKLLTVMTYFIRCSEVKETICLDQSEVSAQDLHNSWVNIEYPRKENLPQEKSNNMLQQENQYKYTTLFGTTDVRSQSTDFLETCAPTSPQNLKKTTSNEYFMEKLPFDALELKKSSENLQIRCHKNDTFTVAASLIPSASCSVPLLKHDPIHSPTLCHSTVVLDADSKCLSARLEILSQDMQRRKKSKKFPRHELKGGNFCSPAVAEWETDEYLISPTSSGRESAERELTPDRLTNNTEAQKGDGQRFAMSDIHDRRGLRKETESVQTRSDCFERSQSVHETTSQENTGTASKSNEENSPGEGFCPSSGLLGMKRTQSCRTKLKDMTENSHGGLYPNIDELAKMENIQLDGESPYRDYGNGTKSTKTPVDMHSQNVQEKVSKLCRVPTSAILFHLESAEDELRIHSEPLECFNTKVIESERQSEANAQSIRSSSSLHLAVEGDKLDQRVFFVIGENEELKGIKHRVENVKYSVGCDSKNLNFEVPTKTSLNNNVSVMGNVSEPRVLTVKSDYIDLEVESGYFKTENNDESSFLNQSTTKFVTETLPSTNSMSRSSSINLPIAKRNRINKISRVCRRHTEIYCDKCKTILREQHKLENLHQDCEMKNALSKCEKCYYTHQKHDSIGLGNFRRTRSEKLNLNLKEGISAPISRSQENVPFDNNFTVEYDKSLSQNSQTNPSESAQEILPREENAMFEQYNPSDEEIIVPLIETSTSFTPEVAHIGFSDLHVVELPLPCCRSGETSVVGLAGSLLGGVSNRYISDLVIQGCCSLPVGWEATLRRDLAVTAKLPMLGQEIAEAVCLVANTSSWEVQLVSSHSYVVDKPGTFGVRVGMSQLVANMLESLNDMFQLKTSPEHCLAHLESKLRELVLRSQALAELLLTTEFCNMELLTSTLELEANDVPLLLAVATTHSPEIATRYGLSFI